MPIFYNGKRVMSIQVWYDGYNDEYDFSEYRESNLKANISNDSRILAITIWDKSGRKIKEVKYSYSKLEVRY